MPIFSMIVRREGREGIIAAKQSIASRKMSSHISRGILSPVTFEQSDEVRLVHLIRSRGDSFRDSRKEGVL